MRYTQKDKIEKSIDIKSGRVLEGYADKNNYKKNMYNKIRKDKYQDRE